MTIKAIFFDLGNVLLDIDWSMILGDLLGKTGLAREEIGSRFMSAGFEEYELGHLSTETFFGNLKISLGYPGDVDELARICTDIFVPISENVSLAHELRSHYRLGIISNTNAAHVAWFSKKYNMFDIFDVRIYSNEVHLRKPNRAIYELALEAFDVTAAESVFIDDLEENTAAAARLGMHAIQFGPDINLRYELSDLLGEKIL